MDEHIIYILQSSLIHIVVRVYILHIKDCPNNSPLTAFYISRRNINCLHTVIKTKELFLETWCCCLFWYFQQFMWENTIYWKHQIIIINLMLLYLNVQNIFYNVEEIFYHSFSVSTRNNHKFVLVLSNIRNNGLCY